jgi:hypothetical protein
LRSIPVKADGRSQQKPTVDPSKSRRQEPAVDPDTLFNSLLCGRVRTVGKLAEPTAD